MDTEVSAPVQTVQCKKKKKNRGKRKSRKRYVNGSRRRGCRGGVKNREQRLKKLEKLLSTQIGTAAPTSASNPNGPSATDLTLFDEDTIELPPSTPFIQVPDTDVFAKVRFPQEVPDEVPDAHLRHHSSGQQGTPPVARFWCADKPREMHPDVPCNDTDFV
ncbi:uncharacterized protein LOC122568885 [Bombus pyrosoma]|uniref:uncharacterized protein LOC122568885 n=1 Tax=Bombus pyrosoma TaxID=396416 RepID=UPI001CB8FB98|nr:uncharacterized protein LOC122568885 [Bombus pyrosoma]